jgi:sugar phosphate isomerase/epimerase
MLAASLAAAEMEWLQVSKDGRGFVGATSGQTFTPWGFNYDRDYKLRLIEEYWDAEWQTVADDFREMKELGANVVRVHLQFAKFMDGANTPNRKSLDQLGRVLELAEKTGLYLDITGLGCFRKGDVPRWYNEAAEEQRWAAQARFWEAIAERCAASPAVFFYDLMNEPVVPSGKRNAGDWMTGELSGLSYVQFISLDQAGRARPEIARQWIAKLVAAIRKHDRRRLISAGLLPDADGKSGFVQNVVAPELDFLCLHIYPDRKKLADDLKTVEAFAVGKPLIIEETFPINCSAEELRQFIGDSGKYACGWIGFYWGKTPAQLRESKDIGDALMLAWLEMFQKAKPAGAAPK